MKKTTLILSLFVFTSTVFTGCNKKKLDDLEKDLAATKSELNDVKNSNNTNTNALQTSYPINIQIKGNRSFDSTAFSYNSSIAFMWDENYNANYVEAKPNGTFDFWIDRYSTANGALESYIWITDYDPAVGMSSANYEVYFENRYALTDTIANLYLSTYGDNYDAENLTINSISYNKNTHAFSFNGTVVTTEGSSNSSTYNPSTTTFSYNGVLTPNTTVNRTGVASRRRAK